MGLEKRKWTQDEFADVSGFHRAYIGTVERGETNVTLKNIEIIAKALGVKFVDLFRGLDDWNLSGWQIKKEVFHSEQIRVSLAAQTIRLFLLLGCSGDS